MAQQLELGMISSTWLGTKVGASRRHPQGEGDRFRHLRHLRGPARHRRRRRAAEIKETARRGRPADPLRRLRRVRHRRLQPSVRRFTLDRIKAYVDQGAYLGARNVLLVVGEYYWDGEVFPNARRSGTWRRRWSRRPASTRSRRASRSCSSWSRSTEALLKDVDELVRFVARDRPPGRTRERRHLAPAPLERVLRGRREADGADRAHPPVGLRRQGARRPAGRPRRDPDQGLPAGDPSTRATTAPSRSSSSTRPIRTRSSSGRRRPTTARRAIMDELGVRSPARA